MSKHPISLSVDDIDLLIGAFDSLSVDDIDLLIGAFDSYRRSPETDSIIYRLTKAKENMERDLSNVPIAYHQNHMAMVDIDKERRRQEVLKSEGRFAKTCADDMPNSEKLTVLIKEVGEVARAILEESNLANDKHGTNLRKELCQVAAVCVAWLESLP